MLLEPRGFPARPSVSQCARDAGRRAAAADLSARLVRLQRAARRRRSARPFPSRIISRPSRPTRRCGSIATASSRRRRTTSRYAILGTRWSAPTPMRKPSGWRRPSISISCAAPKANICRWLRRKTPPPIDYTPVDRARIAQNRAKLLGRLARRPCKAKLEPLIEGTKADELMVTTMIFDHAARRHSYELLAQLFGLKAR